MRTPSPRLPPIAGLGLLATILLPAAAPRAQDTSGAPVAPDEARASAYCTNIASAAADARFRWQKETLTALEKDVGTRIGQLEAKRAEYEEWLRRRKEFLAKAGESVTAIYARMRPEAASQQLATMSLESAAAILVRLEARIASAILNEMEPARAAQLANTITDTPKTPPAPEPGAEPRDRKNSEKTG